MKYPSTKNVLMIFIAILLVGGAFVFAEYRNKQAESIYSAPEITKIDDALDDSQKLDTDNDGIPDWEEILVGTDPKSPNKKSTKNSTTSMVKDLTKTPENLTATDKLSRDFFARYMELRQMGVSADKQSQAEIISKSLSNGLIVSGPKTYTSAGIITRADNSKESVRKYVNDAGSVFKKYIIDSRNETVIAKEAVDTKDYSVLKEIDPIIISYRNIFNGLLKVEVPRAMSQMHVDLINSVNILLYVAEGLRKVDIDPLLGIQATSMYINGSEGLANAYNAIQSYLIFLGITYKSNEGGSFFMPNN